jgi:hypothetical protein
MLSLYISDQKIDLPEKFNILFSHTLEDRTNPTVVKNSFSKTLELPGTDNNNKVFGTFFRNDRYQLYGASDTGAYFDPSKRVPFAIYENGDLIQDGYCKLDKVKRTNEQVLYYVSLFGGLGEFFYNLTYRQDGVEKKLSDLDFGEDLSFKINKDTVKSAWDTLGTTTENKWQTINFAPVYNGIPEDFSSDKVLINTAGSSLFTTSKTDDQIEYTTRNGYMAGELDKSYDEWQIRDLRSYLQRPVLRVKSLLEACFNPANNKGDTNTGYTVDLDEDFFNETNPYWEDAWISLPMLNTDNESELISEPSRATFNPVNTTSGVTGTTRINIDGTEISSDNGVIDLSDYPFSYINVSVDMSLQVTGVNTNYPTELRNFDFLYMSSYSNWGLFGGKHRASYGAVMAQLLAYDADTNQVLDGSDILCFFEPPRTYRNGKKELTVNVQDFVGTGAGKYQPVFNANYAPVRGIFWKKPGATAHTFTETALQEWDSAPKHTAWRLSLDKCPKVNRMRFELRLNKAWCAIGDKPSGNGWDAAAKYLYYGFPFSFYTTENRPTAIQVGTGSLNLTAPSSVSTDTLIDQNRLLSTEYTPADYLLAYSKMFGLYWFKDQYENKIYCRTRNNFFYPVVEDINDLIDRSQPMEVTPFTFDHKWYSMTQETPETYFGEKYLADWGKVYGEQKINTNYNFDSECKEMFENFPYQNAIMARASSTYFADYQNHSGDFVPCFFLDGWTGKLFSGSNELEDDYSPNLVDWSTYHTWYDAPAFDWLPKACYYELDNNERKPVEINNVLLFYNGKSTTPDHFWITDDNNYMVSLCDGVCWLYTERSTDEEGNTIAIRANTIPSFSRYKTSGGAILRSFDFGDPKELYVDNLSLGTNSSIYDQYWKDYLSDQYNVNARVVTCYVLWDRIVKEELQRRFWFFDNSIWMLNRIIDYDLNGYKPTKCEFVKIINTVNYTKAQILPVTRANDGTSYDDPENPRPPVTKSSDDPWNGYDPTGNPCTIITFQDPLTEAYCVSNWDTNRDGKLDICEAAAVESLGTVFKGTGIEYFDEIVYFTGISGIEAGAFSGCTNLDHIILPDNIDYIRDNAFKDCTGLTYIRVESTDPPVLGEGAFDNGNDCPIIINCNYLDDFRAQWPEYAYRFQCGVGPDTGDTGSTLILATSITLSVADVVDSGVASYTLEPSNANNYSISWSSSDTSLATIDSNGRITALGNGQVTICVYENVAGLSDCKTINVSKTPSGYGWIEVVPPSMLVDYTSGQITFNITTENIV